jgi:acetaldehyde dehydrogenase (acetylating)
MALYERLCGRNEQGQADENLQKIAIDQFAAMLIEQTYGGMDRATIISINNLNASEVVELDTILALGGNASQQRELAARIQGMFHLAEGDVPGYGLPSQLKAHVEGL